MKKTTPKYIKLISNPTIFIWLLIYYSPNKSVVLVTRLQKSFFLFIKEFIGIVFKGEQINLFEEDLFVGDNFGPFSRDVAKSIAELKIQNKIEIEDKVVYEKKEIISNDLTNNFFDEDNYLDGIYTKNYKIFHLTDSDENNLTIDRIKKIFNDNQGNFDDFEKQFKLFSKKMCDTNINNILRYVYEKYPDYIGKSIIKDSVLSKKVGG